MPMGSHFINVSRGEIAVEKDVIDALQSGRLAGAYLDVFEREPLDPASPLWDMPNVLISPHTASHSLGQNEAIFEIFLDNLARFRAGQSCATTSTICLTRRVAAYGPSLAQPILGRRGDSRSSRPGS